MLCVNGKLSEASRGGVMCKNASTSINSLICPQSKYNLMKHTLLLGLAASTQHVNSNVFPTLQSMLSVLVVQFGLLTWGGCIWRVLLLSSVQI